MPSQSEPKTTSLASTHLGRWVVVLLMASFCAMAAVSWKLARALGAVPSWGFQPPAMAAAQHSPEDVIGDLGGMPVKISRFVAEYVEYEGDPGWSGPRKGPPPVRTYASKLKSFGFQVRYPDMAMLTSSEMWTDMASYNIYNTPWMDVGITTGMDYPGRGFMNRPHVSNGQLSSDNWWDDYVEVKHRPYGLTEYRLTKPAASSNAPSLRLRDYGKTVYLYRDPAGKVMTRIDCSNVPHEAAPCVQEWTLEDSGVEAWIRIHYRRGWLGEWRAIQRKTTQVILGFRNERAIATETQAVPPATKLESKFIWDGDGSLCICFA